MTWEVSKDAAIMYRKIRKVCDMYNSDVDGTFIVGKQKYTIEPDYITNDDGSITGDIFHLDYSENVKRVEPFMINSNGEVKKGNMLKKFVKKHIK